MLQALGDLVAVEVLVGLVEDGEQHQAHEAGIQLALEFLRKPLLLGGVLGRSSGVVSCSTERYLSISMLNE